jgi:hypothetical protein
MNKGKKFLIIDGKELYHIGASNKRFRQKIVGFF